LGEDEFVDKVEALKKREELFLLEISLEEIAREVMRQIEIPQDRLYSLTRDRRGALGRNLVAYLARKLTGTRVKEIARYFNREAMTMSLGVMKIENQLLRDMDLAERVEIMEKNLRKRGKKKYFITIA